MSNFGPDQGGILVTAVNYSKEQLQECIMEVEIQIRTKKKDHLVKVIVHYSGHGCCAKAVKSHLHIQHREPGAYTDIEKILKKWGNFAKV